MQAWFFHIFSLYISMLPQAPAVTPRSASRSSLISAPRPQPKRQGSPIIVPTTFTSRKASSMEYKLKIKGYFLILCSTLGYILWPLRNLPPQAFNLFPFFLFSLLKKGNVDWIQIWVGIYYGLRENPPSPPPVLKFFDILFQVGGGVMAKIYVPAHLNVFPIFFSDEKVLYYWRGGGGHRNWKLFSIDIIPKVLETPAVGKNDSALSPSMPRALKSSSFIVPEKRVETEDTLPLQTLVNEKIVERGEKPSKVAQVV